MTGFVVGHLHIFADGRRSARLEQGPVGAVPSPGRVQIAGRHSSPTSEDDDLAENGIEGAAPKHNASRAGSWGLFGPGYSVKRPGIDGVLVRNPAKKDDILVHGVVDSFGGTPARRTRRSRNLAPGTSRPLPGAREISVGPVEASESIHMAADRVGKQRGSGDRR